MKDLKTHNLHFKRNSAYNTISVPQGTLSIAFYCAEIWPYRCSGVNELRVLSINEIQGWIPRAECLVTALSQHKSSMSSSAFFISFPISRIGSVDE